MWEGEEGRSLHANKGGQESSGGDEREIMERGEGGGRPHQTNNQQGTPSARAIHQAASLVRAFGPPPPPLGNQASGQGQQRVRTAVNDARREEWAGGVMGEMERNAEKDPLLFLFSGGPSKLARHWLSKAKAKEGKEPPFENCAFLSGRGAEG